MRFRELIKQVGEWSRYNFGDQKGAGALAPLAGIIEELGEASEAAESGTTEEHMDAFVDAFIFLADVCYRSGVVIDPDWGFDPNSSTESFSIALGKLSKDLLKTHQGIRGYDSLEFSKQMIEDSTLGVFLVLYEEFHYSFPFADVEETITETWETVRTRDWRNNPTDAHEVAAAAKEEPNE